MAPRDQNVMEEYIPNRVVASFSVANLSQKILSDEFSSWLSQCVRWIRMSTKWRLKSWCSRTIHIAQGIIKSIEREPVDLPFSDCSGNLNKLFWNSIFGNTDTFSWMGSKPLCAAQSPRGSSTPRRWRREFCITSADFWIPCVLDSSPFPAVAKPIVRILWRAVRDLRVDSNSKPNTIRHQ